MQLRVLRNYSNIDKEFRACLSRCKSLSFSVAWASHDFAAYKSLIKHRKKVTKAVIGIHFCQTDPEFIRAFLKQQGIRFIRTPIGVFHPKVFLFENGNGEWNCILGSANFTKAAFERNTEICVAFDHTLDGSKQILSDLRSTISDHWKLAGVFDDDDLEYYQVMWDRARPKINEIEEDLLSQKRPTSARISTPLLRVSWPDYVSKVKNDAYDSYAKRLEILREFQSLFTRESSFNRLNAVERGKIAGYYKEFGWFGSMTGARIFRTRVYENDIHISNALDCIPRQGEVNKAHFMEFVVTFAAAFPNDKGHGIAVASRLLAMKRPDYFVCLDSKNNERLCYAFNTKIQRRDYEKYWDDIIARVVSSRWWLSARPRNEVDAAIWDGRSAFLDSLFYGDE